MIIILAILAVLPAALLIKLIYELDFIEKEPISLLAMLFIFGCLCTIAAFAGETAMGSILPAYAEGSLPYALEIGFLLAALVEEFCKLIALIIGSWWSKAFDYRFDAIVYAVVIALGFATVENLLYVLVYDPGISTAIARGLFAVPGHMFDGACMGVLYGAAKYAAYRKQRKKAFGFMCCAFFVPFLLHGIWDTLALMDSDIAPYILFGFFVAYFKVVKLMIAWYASDDYSFAEGPKKEPEEEKQKECEEEDSVEAMQPVEPSLVEPAPVILHNPGDIVDLGLVLQCPHCRKGMTVPAGHGELLVICPHCGKTFDAESGEAENNTKLLKKREAQESEAQEPEAVPKKTGTPLPPGTAVSLKDAKNSTQKVIILGSTPGLSSDEHMYFGCIYPNGPAMEETFSESDIAVVFESGAKDKRFPDHLPNGSLVYVKDQLMVVCRSFVRDKDDNMWDYSGLPYPDGISMQEEEKFFDRHMTSKIERVGYYDDEWIDCMNKLQPQMDNEEEKREKRIGCLIGLPLLFIFLLIGVGIDSAVQSPVIHTAWKIALAISCLLIVIWHFATKEPKKRD